MGGATCQQTLYSRRRKLVVHHQRSAVKDRDDDEDDVVVVAGRDWLSNNAVNLLSASAVAAMAAYLS